MTEIGEIPKEWEVKKLGDVVEVISGATPKTNINEYWDNGDIYWATPTDITSNGKYIYKTEKSITESGLKNCSAKLLPIGSILMSSRATIGERCINNVPMATNQGFKSLVCKSEVNNEFIYYYVDILKERLIGLASGSTFLEVSKKVVEDIKIAIPNLKEQEKIALILSTVDEQIDNVDALIEKNKELKKGLMQTLLTKGIGHTKFKKTEIGEVPSEWYIKSIDEITKEVYRYPTYYGIEYVEEGIAEIRGELLNDDASIKKESFRYISEKTAKKFPRTKLEGGDIVISVRGTIGKVGYITEELAGSNITANLLRVSMNRNIMNEHFVKQLFLSDIMKRKFDEITTATTIKTFKVPEFKQIILAIPTKDEQDKIASILLEVDKKIEEHENKKQKLEELKKGLMQQLLTGMIRVTV